MRSHTLWFSTVGLALAVGLAVSGLTTSAQTRSLKHSPPLKEAAPQRVGVSPERLARIDAMCERAIQHGQVPGVAALVARQGKIVYYKAFGVVSEKGQARGGEGSPGTFDWGGLLQHSIFRRSQGRAHRSPYETNPRGRG